MQKSWCFHLSLNVASLKRAIDFYRLVFDMEPAKCHDDYAKFEVVEPPVVFSLVPHAVGADGGRSRVGLSLESAEQVQEIRQRLENQGIHIDAVGAAGIKAADPDGNLWQFSTPEDEPAWDMPEPKPIQAVVALPSGQPVVWEHYVTADLPERIPHGDASVDEVRLTGTFNTSHTDGVRARFVADAFRVLKPGGKVVAHGLAGDKPFPNGMPALPGLASMVAHVPTHQSIQMALRQAGFTELQFVKFGDKAWFEHDGVQMREIKAVAWKPLAPAEAKSADVIYRGPFRQIRDDAGNTYERGKRVAIPAATWTALRQSPQAGQFVFIEADQTNKTCQVH